MAGQTAHDADFAVATQPRDADYRYNSMDAVPQLGASSIPASVVSDTDYDLLPYPSMPIAYTQPAHLAALGTLFGISPAAAENARVLEFGCAAGGNIIPLAARFPGATFLGIDLSQRHIADGRKRIAALGLGNIRLMQADLTTFDPNGAQFDYIVCHGVFSWVPKAAQDAIFRLCQDVLAPNGMATISYNVLPGWHLRTAIRELCLRYAGTEGTPQRRVARARAALEQIAEASDPADPYGFMMQTEARRLKGVPAAYILGEFLAPDNAPCYVKDFIGRAATHDLDYLCEADLFAAVPPALDATIRGRVTAFSGADRSGPEQDIDFLTGRLFRRSILVPRQPAGQTPRIPRPKQLQSLHVSSPLRLNEPACSETAMVFVDDQARPVTIRDPAVSQAIVRLAAAYPATLSVDELTRDSGPSDDVNVAERVRQAVFTLVMAGRAGISVLPLRVGQWDQPRPAVCPLARMEAASGQPWITSLRHTGVPALPVLKVLLPCLDGSCDRAALRTTLIAALQTGAVPMPKPAAGEDLPAHASLDKIANDYLDQTLRYLGREALLEPDRLQSEI